MKKSKSNWAYLVIIVIGVILIIIGPYVLIKYLDNTLYENTGQIGDTIGGITAPIASVLGAILIYLALREQLKSINLQEEQFNYFKEKDNLFKLYEVYENKINEFLFENKDFYQDPKSKTEMKLNPYSENKKRGIKSIELFIERYIQKVFNENNELISTYDEDYIYHSPEFSEFNSITIYGNTIVKHIDASSLDKEDKLFFASMLENSFCKLIYPLFYYRIHVFFSNDEKYICEKCGLHHKNMFPSRVFHDVINLNNKINQLIANYGNKELS